MDNRQLQILSTSDGSCTLFDPDLNETFHSLHGALSESLHVYITNGLHLLVERGLKQIHILEVGFGTGLNLLLTLQNRPKDLNIHYLTIEPFPLSPQILRSYYQGFEGSTDFASSIEKIAVLEPDMWHELEDGFHFKCLQNKVQNLSESDSKQKADLVYFDAFAPSRQPEMWSMEVLNIIAQNMSQDGLMTTYCAQGQFKRTLKALGFKVDNPKGANGKREMTLAWKQE